MHTTGSTGPGPLWGPRPYLPTECLSDANSFTFVFWSLRASSAENVASCLVNFCVSTPSSSPLRIVVDGKQPNSSRHAIPRYADPAGMPSRCCRWPLYGIPAKKLRRIRPWAFCTSKWRRTSYVTSLTQICDVTDYCFVTLLTMLFPCTHVTTVACKAPVRSGVET